MIDPELWRRHSKEWVRDLRDSEILDMVEELAKDAKGDVRDSYKSECALDCIVWLTTRGSRGTDTGRIARYAERTRAWRGYDR